MSRNILSETAMSNLFTMGVSAKIDPRQKINKPYTMPDAKVRELRARLIMEEAMEACEALGVQVDVNTEPDNEDSEEKRITFKNLTFYASDDPTLQNISNSTYKPDMEQIIDACCDAIYVCVGTLCACGVPDEHHMRIVNEANNAKFPAGKAILNPDTGKFQKPDGWKPPEHLRNKAVQIPLMCQLSDRLVENPAMAKEPV